MTILNLHYNFNIILLSPRRIFCSNNKLGIHLTDNIYCVLVSTYICNRFMKKGNALLQRGWEVQENSSLFLKGALRFVKKILNVAKVSHLMHLFSGEKNGCTSFTVRGGSSLLWCNLPQIPRLSS